MSPRESQQYDLLRPNFLLAFKTLTRSQSTWQTLLSSVQSGTDLPYPCCNVKALLNKTPSIPQSIEVTECSGTKSLSLEGYSRWSVSPAYKLPSHTCELPPIKTTLSRKVYIGESRPKTCSLSAEYISEWTGFQPLSEPMSNYLSVFVLGWSYILSARLIEIRRKTAHDKVVYTYNQTQWDRPDGDQAGNHFDLDIGSDSYAEVQWWAAVLAEGCGWEATLARDGREYYPPWECHLNNSPFRLRHCAQMPSSIATIEPPSSAEAQQYLFNFARYHDAFDQLIGALAAAITLPSHNRFGSSVVLPKPIKRHSARHNTALVYANQIPTADELPHFMALSCTSGLIASCLFGSFWEPGIPCNLASQWLHPPTKKIFPPFIQSKNFRPIICAMSQRRPNVASLWLGSTITGLLPRIFQVSRTFLPTIYLEATIWTGSPQSFMDPNYHRLTPVKKIDGLDMISREDEFRVLFVTDVHSETYGNPPLSPYPPFGLVDVQNTSLNVRLHLSCDHRPNYTSWDWQCQNGQVLRDFGMSHRSKSAEPSSSSHILQSISVMVVIMCTSLYRALFGVHTWLQKVSRLPCLLGVRLLLKLFLI